MAASFSNVPLGVAAWRRDFSGSVQFDLLNRFFEQDPTSSEDPTALLARPGTDFYRAFGAKPPRALFTQDGFMGGDLFIVSGATLYRHDPDGADITISGALSEVTNTLSITYQATPGIERLWLADGDTLWYYEGASKALGTLSVGAGTIADNDTVEIGGTYYKWTVGSVDAGTPQGTLANPWLVALGATNATSLSALADAIGATGTPGSTYSTALTAHPNAEVRRINTASPGTLQVQAKVAGAAGNSITTTETSTSLSWGAATFQNGGQHFLSPVGVPESTDAFAPLALATLAGWVVIVTAGTQRMFAIRPGEFWVEVFFEAENEPDFLLDIRTVGDVFWAFGQSTIEPWSPTGDEETPFAPIQGRIIKYGLLSGTAAVVSNEVIYVDTGGVVRDSSGRRLSTHAVEEQIRLARTAA